MTVFHSERPIRCGGGVFAHNHRIRYCTPQYAMVYVIHGRAHFTDNQGRTYPVHTGDAYQRYPNQVHYVEYEADTHTVWGALPAEFLDMVKKLGFPLQAQQVIQPGLHLSLVRKFQQVEQALLRSAPEQRALISLQVQELLLQLHRYALDQSHEDPARDAIEQACDFLVADFDRPLPHIATAVGMDYPAFRKAFMRLQGMAPGQYRMQQRLALACDLLQETSLSYEDIAEQLLFTDRYAFAHQFKKYHGVAPGAFRKRWASE